MARGRVRARLAASRRVFHACPAPASALVRQSRQTGPSGAGRPRSLPLEQRGSRRTRRRSRPGRSTSPRRMRPMPSASRSPPAAAMSSSRRLPQDGQLGPQAAQQLRSISCLAPASSRRRRRRPRPAPRAAGSGCERDAARPGGRLRGGRPVSSTRCITPTVTSLPQTGQMPPCASVVGGSQAMPQARWPSRWYLPSSGKNSIVPQDTPCGSPASGAALEKGGVGQLGVEKGRLARQLLGRVRVGVGDQRVAVQVRHAPVHRRIGREAGLQGEDVRRQVAEALLHRVEAGLRAEQREPGRPDVRGDQVAAPGRRPA